MSQCARELEQRLHDAQAERQQAAAELAGMARQARKALQELHAEQRKYTGTPPTYAEHRCAEVYEHHAPIFMGGTHGHLAWENNNAPGTN